MIWLGHFLTKNYKDKNNSYHPLNTISKNCNYMIDRYDAHDYSAESRLLSSNFSNQINKLKENPWVFDNYSVVAPWPILILKYISNSYSLGGYTMSFVWI